MDVDLPDPLGALSEHDRVATILAPWLRGRPIAALSADERAALAAMSGADEALIARLAAAQARSAELAALLPPALAAAATPAPVPSPAPAPTLAPAAIESRPGKASAAAQLAAAAAGALGKKAAEELRRVAEEAARKAAEKAAEDLRRAAEEAAKKAAEELRRAAEEAARREREQRPPLDLAPPLYALVAAYGDATLPKLLLHSRAALKAELERAAKEKVIAPLAAPVAALVVEALAAGRDRLHFNLADDGRYADAKAVAWAPLVPPALKSKLLDALIEAPTPTAALDAVDGITAAQKSLFGEIFALFTVIGRHAPMLAALSQEWPIFRQAGDGLDQDRLHLMTADDWRALVKVAGLPMADRDSPGGEARYAAGIVAATEAAAPGRGLAARLAASKLSGSTALARTLAANADFDIRKQPVNSYFTTGGDGQGPRLNDSQATLLAAVQRTVQIAPNGNFATAEAMIEHGFTSGYALVAAGKAEIRDKLGPTLGFDQADLIYRNAQQLFADTYALAYADQSGWLNELVGSLAIEDRLALPNLKTLFGNADFCACAHCQSVYGPAAYLADLLHWMRADLVDNGQRAYDVLKLRRPDIPKILLNCANANTAMPYIDIVNEVLSYGMLAPGTGPALGDLQTHGEIADRLLEPEYRGKFAAADAMLLKETVQWRLPYDPLYDEARACLEATGRDHEALVEALSASGWAGRSAVERTAWACARFGIIEEELAIIATDHSGAGIGFWKAYWGLKNASNGASVAPAAQVKPLLATGEFPDLAALAATLKTDFARGAGGVFPFDHIGFQLGAPCDVDQAFLAKADDSALTFDVAAADRVMRFERLRRRAGLGVAELDRAIAAFGTGGLDLGFVHRLAAATAAADRLGLPLDTLSGWFRTPATDWSADFAAALGLGKADFEAANALVGIGVDPWRDPDVTLQFLFEFDRLRDVPIAPAELRAMLEGTGRWQLDASGIATDKATAKAARAAWETFEAALAPAPPADPTASATVKQQRDNAIDLALAAAVGLPVALVSQLIYAYVSAVFTVTSGAAQVPLTGPLWRERFRQPRETVNPAGVKTVNRSWDNAGAVAGLFSEMYRYLSRSERIMVAAGLDTPGAQALVFIAVIKENPSWFLTADFPVPLDLVFNRFGPVALSGAPLAWLRRAARNAKALAVAPFAFFMRASAVKMGLVIPPFSVWAAAEMEPGSVLAGLDSARLQKLADIAEPLEAASDFGAQAGRILDLSQLAADIALPLDQLVKLVWVTIPSSGTTGVANRFSSAQVGQIKSVLQAEAGNRTAWIALYQPIANRLRRDLRDALVAYYLGQRLYADIPELYAHFLIDPEMEPCMKTSRIVQATNACQTLVQRGLLGLEPGVALDEGDKKQWVWRRNYRVWEANRKVFLYPEDWTFPSLRLVKTPLFADAQDHLLQDELNEANVERVFNTYLTKLEDISRLDIRGTYYDNVENLLHVFARTWNPPYAYFYRRRGADWRWSAWEEVPLDIESDSLIPVVFNRRLYLFWPTFTEKEHRRIRTPANEGAPYVELRLCYSKLEFGKWSPKKQYEKSWAAGRNSGPDLFDESRLRWRLIRREPETWWDWPYDTDEVSLDPKAFYFWAEEKDGDLVIHVRRASDPSKIFDYLAHEVDILISGCDERLEFRRPYRDPALRNYIARPWGSDQYGQQLSQSTFFQTSAPLTIGVRTDDSWAFWASGTTPILGKAHYPYTLTYPHQWRSAVAHHSFFLADRQHTHLLTRFWVFWAYVAELHEHPHCCLMLRELHRLGIDGLLAPEGATNPLRRQQIDKAYFAAEYLPVSSRIATPHPSQSFDFAATGSYSAYNWEIFFHLPALIGNQLRLDGKHAEALRWLSFIFDPTNRDDPLDPARFWMFRPFHEHVSQGSIDALMRLLQSHAPQDQPKRQAFAAQIAQWQKHPFEPHAIAEMRIEAYMRWTVMEYIQTLIDWGDKLFRQFTTESVNEALQLYMLAKQILGPRPRQVEGKTRPDRTFEDLLASLDEFSNAAAIVENAMTGVWHQPANGNPRVVSPPALYFCIPENPQLLALWDRVEERVFRIEHCRDIDGNLRELALFAPEIDPGMLVKAVASGLDLSEILDSLAAPSPHHRFSYLLQQATSFCGEVKALGGQLLAALEKRDAEALADLRQVHEINLLSATRSMKKMAVQEAKQSLAAAEYAKKLAETRLDHYSTRQFMIAEESSAKALTDTAHNLQIAEHGLMVLSGVLALFEMDTGTSGNGVHFAKKIHPATAVSLAGQALGAMASSKLNKASRALTAASYIRRQEDWFLQAALAAQEVQQADKQIAAAEIRLAIAEKDLDNHDLQVEQSKAVHDWMRAKFTGEQLYRWMAGKLKTLHRQAYNLAYGLALQAQKAFQIELGRTEAYVQFGAWDSGHSGLLAGETLGGQLRELEAAYMRFNAREFELTRSISLRLLAPQALVDLWRLGEASFEIPEWLLATVFKDNMKLHAMQIKSVAVSLPCVTGPHTAANLKLRLDESKIRWDPTKPLVTVPQASLQQVVTSTAVSDPALFEANLRDERYLPFENAGAVSKWTVTLPAAAEFDRQTIADLILHLRFTARGSVEAGAAAAAAAAQAKPDLLLSWRRDLPEEWLSLSEAMAKEPATVGTATAGFSVPNAPLSAIPYRVRIHPNAAASPIAYQAWVVYRDSDGERVLSDALSLSPKLEMHVAAPPTGLGADNRALVASFSASSPNKPDLSFADPSGKQIVEDVLIAFHT